MHQIGPNFIISSELHKLNRTRVQEVFKASQELKNPKSIIFLESGKSTTRPYTDTDHIFRQESYYHWLTGVKEPNGAFILDLDTGVSYLFIEKLTQTYEIWEGHIKTVQEIKELYDVDHVHYYKEVSNILQKINPFKIYCLDKPEIQTSTPQDYTSLKKILNNLRMVKTDFELELIKYVNKVSSYAHTLVMQKTRPLSWEYQQEAQFVQICYDYGGCRLQAYTPICASGPNSAILHYGHASEPNARQIQAGDLCLLDLGAEYHCYASDITRTFPASGIFTQSQRELYELILKVQEVAINNVKPGVIFRDIHIIAIKELITGLIKLGFLTEKVEVEELIKQEIHRIFMPHGIGHHMGVDVHDVGDHFDTVLAPNMVLTIEPGVYFIKTLLDQTFVDIEKSKYLNISKLQKYKNFGGIRIEDNIIVNNTGCEVITHVPKTVLDIQNTMWKQ